MFLLSNSSIEWLVWTFQFDLNDVRYEKAGKFVARSSLFKLNETRAIVCFSNIFLEQYPLNSSMMPCNKRETFPGKIRNNSVADNLLPWVSQMKQFAPTVLIIHYVVIQM